MKKSTAQSMRTKLKIDPKGHNYMYYNFFATI